MVFPWYSIYGRRQDAHLMLLVQAQAFMPGMPGIQQASVQSARGGVFANVLAPGRLGEVAQVCCASPIQSKCEWLCPKFMGHPVRADDGRWRLQTFLNQA